MRAPFLAPALVLLVLGPSVASARGRAHRPAASVLGDAKEELAPPAPAARPGDADRALLRALLYAFDPAPREIRVIAVEDLGLLGDPRGLDALSHLILDPDPAVQLAAVRTVGHLQAPRAEEILANVIRHPILAQPLKVAALKALPFQGTATARELLEEVASDHARYSETLRHEAESVLARLQPGAATALGTK